ncbi:hypothetical protein GQ53DRAFT_748506 [Thozetella sp. PMI_491]|nr:hypothetical protein GQ53DRAFT_748506 [Thozetella sp. PMI_491]
MPPQSSQSYPFSIQLLKSEGAEDVNTPKSNEYLLSLLPASYRTDRDDLATPHHHASDCLEKELSLERLDIVYDWLWVAGRPMPPRPLHHQLILGRQLFVSQRMDLHLVWTTGRIYLKPIPRYLLEPQFWADYLACGPGCTPSKEDSNFTHQSDQPCSHRRLRRSALGFLFSYAALISHESDFELAKEKRLMPNGEQVTWQNWRTLIEQLDTENIYPKIDRRFFYGELRLDRLNTIYRVVQGQWARGYMIHWKEYSPFFQYNFAWIASATVYMAIALTAMQVGLGTSLAESDAFQSASYGFTVFCIVAPLGAVGIVVILFACVFASNWIATVRYKKRRLCNIGAAPPEAL